MEGHHAGFKWHVDRRYLVVSSQDPRIGELKRYTLAEEQLRSPDVDSIARERIDADIRELEELEQRR